LCIGKLQLSFAILPEFYNEVDNLMVTPRKSGRNKSAFFKSVLGQYKVALKI